MSLLGLLRGVRNGPRGAKGYGGMLLVMMALAGLLPRKTVKGGGDVLWPVPPKED